MEHRKRSMMQHKVDLSTLLRIVIASRRSGKLWDSGKIPQNLTKALALQATESLKSCDHTVGAMERLTHIESLFARKSNC